MVETPLVESAGTMDTLTHLLLLLVGLATLMVNKGRDITTARLRAVGTEPLNIGWGTGAGTDSRGRYDVVYGSAREYDGGWDRSHIGHVQSSHDHDDERHLSGDGHAHGDCRRHHH